VQIALTAFHHSASVARFEWLDESTSPDRALFFKNSLRDLETIFARDVGDFGGIEIVFGADDLAGFDARVRIEGSHGDAILIAGAGLIDIADDDSADFWRSNL